MRISEFQKLIEETYFERDARRGLGATFLWFAEEVGELAKALRKNDDRQNLNEEFADVLAWLFTLASLSGVRMEAAIEKYAEGCPACRETPCNCPEDSLPSQGVGS